MLNHINFKRWQDGSVLVTNDFGRFAFLNAADFTQMVCNRVPDGSDLQRRLKESLFVLDGADLYSPVFAQELRQLRNHLFNATSLHIFVVTNVCNLRCTYCQAWANRQGNRGFMDEETARKSVDLALQSPSKTLTFEFQGGEPLANFDAIREIVTYAENSDSGKRIGFALVSNLALLNDEMANFIVEHDISVSTSLDGPQALHDANRPYQLGGSSYELALRGLTVLRERGCNVGGIQTTTRRSLSHASDIVREYEQLGFTGIFLRPLTPLGHAVTQWDKIGYTAEEFISFYREAFAEILQINKKGTFFPEQLATILLRKILHNEGQNYMDLRSPCGAGIGQLAYYYDGDVYTCDEARMLAEAGDRLFRLGNVHTNSYTDIIGCGTCRATCASSITETIPSCCDCVYQPYCGTCPVVNYALERDVFPRGINRYRCKVYSGILDYIFELLHAGESSTMDVFESWLAG